jgi:hypothetical protein
MRNPSNGLVDHGHIVSEALFWAGKLCISEFLMPFKLEPKSSRTEHTS